MLLEESTLHFQGKPLFQRARFKTPFKVAGKMEDMACFFYMKQGGYEIIDAHGAVQIGPKEALVKKCGSYVAHLKEGEWDGIVIFFYPEVLHEIYKYQAPSFLEEQGRSKHPTKPIGNDLLDRFIKGLSIYFDNPDAMDEELALLKMKELILILLKSAQQNDSRQFIAELFKADKIHFTSAIESNIFSNLSIEEMAFICHKSLSSFKREFKRIYKTTPARYVKERRLAHAAQLLCTTQQAVSDIAFEVGFQDLSTFSALFREVFHKSPTQYRLTQMRK